MAAARGPSGIEEIDALLAIDGSVPIGLCLDVGHQCIPGRTAEQNDPYHWLKHFRDRVNVIQLQQSDASADRHWPFTPERNRAGRIDADRVLDILDDSNQDEIVLILEVIPPFETTDDSLIADMETSVRYWQDALDRRAAHNESDRP